jgi:streptogrisin C
VAMNAKNTTIPGDSGGPWYFNFTAYGSHKGGCTIDGVLRNVFSVADLYDEALGVTVRR